MLVCVCACVYPCCLCILMGASFLSLILFPSLWQFSCSRPRCQLSLTSASAHTLAYWHTRTPTPTHMLYLPRVNRKIESRRSRAIPRLLRRLGGCCCCSPAADSGEVRVGDGAGDGVGNGGVDCPISNCSRAIKT